MTLERPVGWLPRFSWMTAFFSQSPAASARHPKGNWMALLFKSINHHFAMGTEKRKYGNAVQYGF